MKKFKKYGIILLSLLGIVNLTSCEINEITEVREIREVVEATPNIIFEREVDLRFNSDTNNWSVIINYPTNFQSFEDDLVLVYLQNGIDEANNLPLWDALPRTFFLNDEPIVYNFNYSVGGVEIIIDSGSGFDQRSIPANFTNNQLFRIAVLPGQFNNSAKILDNSDFSMENISAKAIFLP